MTTASVLAATLAAGATTLVGAGAVRPPVARMERLLRHPTTPPSRSRRRPAVALGAAALVVWVIAVGALVTLTLVAATLAAVAVRRHRRLVATRTSRHRSFPELLDLITIAVRAGYTPRQAVTVIAELPGPCRTAVAEVVHRIGRGQPFADALAAISEHLGPWAATTVDAIASCDRYGLPVEPLLEQLSSDARLMRQRLDQAEARRLPVRLSFPLVACTLPSFVLLAIVPAVLAALSSLPAGW